MIRNIGIAATALFVLCSLTSFAPSLAQSTPSTGTDTSKDGPIMRLHRKIRNARPHILRKTVKKLAGKGSSSKAAPAPSAAAPAAGAASTPAPSSK